MLLMKKNDASSHRAWSRYADVAKLFIQNGADVNVVAEDGYTPLHMVNHGDVVKVLIENGADLTARVQVRGKHDPLGVALLRTS